MTTLGLREIPTEELVAELEARKDAEERLAYERRRVKRKLAIKHRDALLELMDHCRMSCHEGTNAYYHPEHGVAECNRCCLAALDESDDVDVNVQITLTQYRKDRKR